MIVPIDVNFGTTKMLICRASFQWTIHDYSIYSRYQEMAGEGILKSPTFSSIGNNEKKWSLQLNPNSKYFNNQYSVMLNLSLICGKQNEVQTIMDIKYQIVAKDPEKSHTKYYVANYTNDQSSEWEELIPKRDLFDEANGLLPNDKLTIICDVTAFGAPFNSMTLEVYVPECRMREGMGQLLDNDEFSDVILVASDQEVRAHQAILAAASLVFSEMLKNETMENDENRIELKDFKADVVKEMLRFIYTGKTTKLNEMAFDLLALAEKYDLSTLKANCEISLCRNTSVENSADILTQADLHGAYDVKNNTIDFITSHFAEVEETESYKRMVEFNPRLSLEVLSRSVWNMKIHAE